MEHCGHYTPGVSSLILNSLVTQNRQVGLKNHTSSMRCRYWEPCGYIRARRPTYSASVRCPKGWSLSLALPKKVPLFEITYMGLEAPVSAAEQARFSEQLGKRAALYDKAARSPVYGGDAGHPDLAISAC
jgi:hypothetical protein